MNTLLLTSLFGCDSALVKTSEVDEVDQTPDSVSALVEEVEDDCSNGDEDACDLLGELVEQLEDCSQGNNEACDSVFEDLLDFYTEPQNEWQEDNYLADFEMSRVINTNNIQLVCSSLFLIEIDNNGTLVQN